MNVRSSLLVAAALLSAACATTQYHPAVPGTEEVQLGRYRLYVPKDPSPAARARAFDPQGNEVPVVTVQAKDAQVPTSLTTTGPICSYRDIYGKIHYISCPK